MKPPTSSRPNQAKFWYEPSFAGSKLAIGVAPHAYLVQRRVEMAKHLLLKGHPLRQVATAAGYYDQGHLSREFRRFFGVPPGVARQ
jgi:AraC-like DNA-binding protein